MGIIVTYVCDVSRLQSSLKEDFVEVNITAHEFCQYDKVSGNYYNDTSTKKSLTKFVHKDVAKRLNLINQPKAADPQPEPTLESKLLVLLKEYISDIAYEAGAEAGVESASHRG